MQHVLSTHMFVGHRLTTVWLDKVWNAGVPAVEIFCAKQHLDYRDPAQVRELGHWFRDAQLKLHSLHSPMFSDDVWGRSGPNAALDITEPVKSKRLAIVDEIKRAIEVSETIPCKYLVQHLGASASEYSERGVDAAFSALEEINLFARQRGVDVLLENIPNEFSSPERLVHFLDATHLKLHFCFDAGHANLNGNVAAAFDTMQDRIRSTHLHDNDGASDQHQFPFFGKGGSIDWKQLMRRFQPCQNQFPLLLELQEDPELSLARSLENVQQIFEELESLASASPDHE
jgi:sugar phosphate isomerase/epimerase